MSFLQNNLQLLEEKKLQQQQGERYLQFSLKPEINGLVSLKDLQGTINVSLTDILPIPQVAEFWLGIVNWQGEAVWILDLAQLLGAPNWYRQQPVITSGMVMLIKITHQTIGLLVEKITGIKNYDPQLCLPANTINFSNKMRSYDANKNRELFQGYFMDNRGEPSMVLDINNLFYVLQS